MQRHKKKTMMRVYILKHHLDLLKNGKRY